MADYVPACRPECLAGHSPNEQEDNNMKTRKTLSALTVASVFALAAPFAAPVMAQQAAPTAEVTADELDAFVVAYQSVAALDQEYGQQIDEAEDRKSTRLNSSHSGESRM